MRVTKLNIIKLSLVALITSALAGCGYIYGDNGLIKNQEYSYVDAKQLNDLKLPPTLNHKGSANYTVVPKLGNKVDEEILGKNLKQAAPIQLLAVLDNIRVDKKSVNPSILIIDDLEFLWQTMTLFLDKNNLTTEQKNHQDKIILTNWLAIEKAGVWLGLDGEEEPDLNRAKYKIVIKDGEIKGEYNLSVQRVNYQSRESDENQWIDQKIGWQESADMMNLILSFYDQRVRQQTANHHQKIMAGFKVVLGQNSNQEPALITSADEKLIWEKIPRVMNELGLKVIDKDRRQKTYFMKYEKTESGFFASLFNTETVDLPLETGTYQMTVSETGEQQALTFKNSEGNSLDSKTLVKLFPELSRLFGDRR